MTRRLRRNVRLAVEQGQSWTGLVGLQPVVKKLLCVARSPSPSSPCSSARTLPLTSRRPARSGRSKHGDPAVHDAVLHLTPLCNKEGKVESLVAVCVVSLPPSLDVLRTPPLTLGSLYFRAQIRLRRICCAREAGRSA